MFWKKKNPLLKLRTELLEGKTVLKNSTGENEVLAIITDIGMDSGGISIVYIADGTCSLYFEKAGGIIGAGEHKNIQIVSTIYCDYIDSVLGKPVDRFELDFPKKDKFSIKVITKKTTYEINDGDQNSSIAFAYANNLLTQFRLLSENKNAWLSDDAIIMSFVKENNIPALKLGLEKLKNPNAAENNKSALLIATYLRKPEIIKILLNAGADINARDETGMNALMVACYLGFPELIEYLSNDKILNSKDSSGYTPLMFASNAGKLECVKKLIELRADVNATDNDNSTPIMFSAQNGFDSIVQLLLENGANINTKGNHGYSALTLAELNKNKTTIEILQNHK